MAAVLLTARDGVPKASMGEVAVDVGGSHPSCPWTVDLIVVDLGWSWTFDVAVG